MTLQPIEIKFRSPIDINRCLKSGQIFTYNNLDGNWVGVDGPNVNYIKKQVEPDRVAIFSNASKATVLNHFAENYDLYIAFQEIVEAEPRFAELLPGYSGLRMMRSHCPVSTIFSFVCTANNHLSRIYPMIQTIQRLGPIIEIELPIPLRLYQFPSLETLSETTEEYFRTQGFGYRAKLIPAIAIKLLEAGGEAEVMNWLALPYGQVREKLMDLPGIGPKLADCIAVFGFHKQEAFPIDTHVYQVAQKLIFTEWADKPLTTARYRELTERIHQKMGANSALVSHLMFAHNLKNTG